MAGEATEDAGEWMKRRAITLGMEKGIFGGVEDKCL